MTVCAIEIESEHYIFGRENFNGISELISDVDLIFAYERTSGTTRIKVTSITFERQ